MVGGHRCTTLAWLEEFLFGLNAGDPVAAGPEIRSPASRTRQATEARRHLEAEWDTEALHAGVCPSAE
jgi:hypothetical protein